MSLTGMRPRVRCRGSSLIEALLAMAIFSVGLLGMAALQLRMNAEIDASRRRTQAVLAVEQLVAAVQTDAANAGCYTGRLAAGGALTAAAACGAPAALDWFRAWAQTAVTSLPQGEVSATFDAATAQYSVQLVWSRPGSDAQNVSMLLEVRP